MMLEESVHMQMRARDVQDSTDRGSERTKPPKQVSRGQKQAANTAERCTIAQKRTPWVRKGTNMAQKAQKAQKESRMPVGSTQTASKGRKGFEMCGNNTQTAQSRARRARARPK
jgi:hypothetical protein